CSGRSHSCVSRSRYRRLLHVPCDGTRRFDRHRSISRRPLQIQSRRPHRSSFLIFRFSLLTPLVCTVTLSKQGSFSNMSIDGKLGPIRKGLLEFLILKIISSDKVYVADMLKLLSTTEFATQEGTLYPLLSKMRRESLVDYEWKESEAGPPRK